MRLGSSLAEVNEIVAAGYDRVADRYVELESPGTPWPRMRRLQGLLERIPEGGEVLDVGCGNGVPALEAIAERHRATGIDLSSAQIEAAARSVPEARLFHADVSACDFGHGSFDAIVALYVLEHIPRENHRQLIARFFRWLRPGGYLLFTTEPSEDPGTVGEWLDEPMFFSQFDQATTRRIVEGVGFELLDQEVEAQLEGDQEIAYVWFLARKGS
jgi:cyclopropane fatty-acyl-phospholipid synthase-like methyltransferase